MGLMGRWGVGGFVALIGVIFLDSCWGTEVITNDWYVQLHGEPGQEVAIQVAKRNGFQFVSKVKKLSLLSIYSIF